MSKFREDDFGVEFVRLLALDGNGAVEADLPIGEPVKVVLVGPVKTWWGRMESEEYKVYAEWREAVRIFLIYHGCLVYSPHRAWSGGWHESAQVVNDAAIKASDVLINLTPPGVVSRGSEAEVEVADANNVPVWLFPPSDKTGLNGMLERLLVLRDSLNRSE